MTDQAKDAMLDLLSKYGFSTVIAIGLMWFLRTDIVIPLLDEHRLTLKEIRETQRSIADAVSEQTKLLYALQPREHKYTTSLTVPDDGRN